jgi:hypothetical protein
MLSVICPSARPLPFRLATYPGGDTTNELPAAEMLCVSDIQIQHLIFPALRVISDTPHAPAMIVALPDTASILGMITNNISTWRKV